MADEKPDSDAERQPDDPESAAEAAPSEDEAAAKAAPETGAESATESEAEAESGSESEAESQPEADAAADSEAESQPEADAAAESGSESEPEAQPEADAAAGAETESQPEADAEAESGDAGQEAEGGPAQEPGPAAETDSGGDDGDDGDDGEEDEATEEPEQGPHPLTEATLAQFPEGVAEDGLDADGNPILRVDSDRLIEVMTWLRDDESMAFDFLSSLTAIDWTDREPRFDVVYHLYSIANNHRLSVKVGCADGEGVPSVTELWVTANWHEREAYDLYGVEFLGHPDLQRIFLPEDWEGYPLRKDYPLEGPNLELLTRQQAAFRGGRFDRIRGDYEMSDQERKMAGPGVVGPLWTPPEPEAEGEQEEPSG